MLSALPLHPRPAHANLSGMEIVVSAIAVMAAIAVTTMIIRFIISSSFADYRLDYRLLFLLAGCLLPPGTEAPAPGAADSLTLRAIEQPLLCTVSYILPVLRHYLNSPFQQNTPCIFSHSPVPTEYHLHFFQQYTPCIFLRQNTPCVFSAEYALFFSMTKGTLMLIIRI